MLNRASSAIVGILLGILLAFVFAWLCGTPLPWSGLAVRP
jgi:uncharacterized membrane protein YccC